MTAALLLSLVLLGGPARTRDQDEAEAHARKAEALVAQGRYDEAERELHTAYALDSSPFHLFGLAMVAKLRGDCDRAMGFFERVLEALPTSELDDEARRSTEASAKAEILACGGELPDEAASPATAPAPRLPPPDPAPVPAQPRERPWHRDPAGGALLGVGSVGIAVGTGLLIGAAVTDRNASESDTATGFLATGRRARALGTAGIVTASVGGALVIGAIVRYVVVRRRGSSAAARLTRVLARCCAR